MPCVVELLQGVRRDLRADFLRPVLPAAFAMAGHGDVVDQRAEGRHVEAAVIEGQGDAGDRLYGTAAN